MLKLTKKKKKKKQIKNYFKNPKSLLIKNILLTNL